MQISRLVTNKQRRCSCDLLHAIHVTHMRGRVVDRACVTERALPDPFHDEKRKIINHTIIETAALSIRARQACEKAVMCLLEKRYNVILFFFLVLGHVLMNLIVCFVNAIAEKIQ